METPTEVLEEPHMAQAEKTAGHSAGTAQNGGTNVVTLGPRDSLHGRLEIQGDLKVGGTVEGELKASGDVAVESTANVQASIEGANVVVRGQVTGNVTARRRLTLGGSGHLNGDVKVGRLTVEDGATLNGNVAMTGEKA
jgi:cytoskeletal protein CcmA (bactofilin family)